MISKAITNQANATLKAFNNYNFQTCKYSAQTLTKSVNLQRVQQVVIIHRSTAYYVAMLSDIP